MRNVEKLPEDLPVPTDDGACKHLVGRLIPPLILQSSSDQMFRLDEIFNKPTVLFIYPRAGSPISPNQNPIAWDLIPGARGCTPQTCGYRDHYQIFRDLGVQVYGLSSQSSEIQREFVTRMNLPFEILSDGQFRFTDALGLPTFDFEGERLIKRMAFFILKGEIHKVFYPIFPPDRNATDVLEWLRAEA